MSLMNLCPTPRNMRRTAIAFVISSIFATGEIGAVYEPWDLSTLFKDSIGSIPAVVDQEVGLMLDKSKGLALGAELVTNGDLSNGLEGWSSEPFSGFSQADVFEIVDGQLHVSSANAGTAYGCVSQVSPMATIPEHWYKLVFYLSNNGRVDLRIGNTRGGNTVYGGTVSTGPSIRTYYFKANSTQTWLSFIISAAATPYATFDNFSVKEIAGNHAFQTITASKPILRQDSNGFYYLEHDGLDDYMVTGNVFTMQNDSFMAMAYAYSAASGSSGVPIFGLHKDSLNYLYLAQRPATAHIHSASVRAGNFGLAPANVIASTNSTAPNAPLVTHTRLINNKIYTGKNNVELAPADFLIGANTITGSPLKINSGLALDLSFYGGLYRQKDLTATERANVISYFTQHAGVTI